MKIECPYCSEIELIDGECENCHRISYFDEEREQEFQNWWTQQDQDDQWIHDNSQ